MQQTENNHTEWKQADTGCYLLLRILFGDAQRYAMCYGISIGNGLGKTFTAQHYCKENMNAFHVIGDSKMNRKDLLIAIAQVIGIKMQSHTLIDNIIEIMAGIKDIKEPLLIIDNVQMLKERTLAFVVSIYKTLINHCGVILLGNDEFQMRVVEGVRMQKQLYDGVYNAMGRRFIQLRNMGPRDIELVCRANGIEDAYVIDGIKSKSQNLYQASIHINIYQKGTLA